MSDKDDIEIKIDKLDDELLKEILLELYDESCWLRNNIKDLEYETEYLKGIVEK